jgi:hypothetical protein
VNWRVVIPVTLAVIAIVLLGSVVTKFSLEQMVYLAPIAVVVVGASIGLVMFWVKVIRDMRHPR